MKFVIFHNPRCGKSRTTLKMLEEKGVKPEVRLYLESAPTKEELAEILRKLGKKPREIIRFNEGVAKELKISAKDERPDSEWISLMTKNPILIERPIVTKGNKAVLGRPPENVLRLIR